MGRIEIEATSHAGDEPLTFDYFGEELRVSPDLTDADLLDFMELQADLDSEDPKAAALLKQFIRAVVHTDDFDRFWALARQHRQSTEERAKVAYKIIEAATSTPTARSSDSSAGPQRTDSSSTDASSLRAQHRLEDKGRADLAVAVLQHREGQRVA